MTAHVYMNLTPSELIQLALQRGEGELASNQALAVNTGSRTGRSPKDRFIVADALTETKVAWNTINQRLDPAAFKQLWQKADTYLQQQQSYFVSDLTVGADKNYALTVKVIAELAWHTLFARNLFIHEPRPAQDAEHTWTILAVPGYKAAGKDDGVHSDAAIILNFSERKILICGTYYAGELKKAMFSVLNFLLPEQDVLPMHCAANVGKDGDCALFFGLSGTGKTTLSADPERFLIGDDEHGWGENGVFNFEGGCYAKCIDLSYEREPIIFEAIRHGSVMENVVLDPQTKEPDYTDGHLTQNTRVAYPREFIPQRILENVGQQPNVVLFLTCDLYGVLPPIARLTPEQAAYYFLSGYTALVGSTEVGQSSAIQPTFSTCFGAPFFPRPASVYAELLIKRLQHHPATVYLINTGWTGGAYGQGGTRFSIPTTRAIVSAAINNHLQDVKFENVPHFNFAIPTSVPGVASKLLNPALTWQDPAQYAANKKQLIEKLLANFERFTVSAKVKQAGPTLVD